MDRVRAHWLSYLSLRVLGQPTIHASSKAKLNLDANVGFMGFDRTFMTAENIKGFVLVTVVCCLSHVHAV